MTIIGIALLCLTTAVVGCQLYIVWQEARHECLPHDPADCVRLENRIASLTAELARLRAEQETWRRVVKKALAARRRVAKERDAAQADADGMRIACALYGVGVDPNGYYAGTPGSRVQQLLALEAATRAWFASIEVTRTPQEADLALALAAIGAGTPTLGEEGGNDG